MKTELKEEKTLRAYESVKATDQMPFLHGIKKKMALTTLAYQSKFLSSFIFGNHKQQAELAARQFLLLRINTEEFNRKLLLAVANKEVIEHELLVKEWREILQGEGLAVNNFLSSVGFCFYVFKRFAFNILNICRLFFRTFTSANRTSTPGKKYIQFCDINKNCLPWPGDEKEYTIVNWYINWEGRKKDITEIHHNVKGKAAYNYQSYTIREADHFIDHIKSLKDRLKLAGWFAGSCVVAFFSLLRGHWINALLMHEAMLGKIVSMIDPGFLAEDYLFSISNFSYRPYWTYIAEEKGSLITNYSYASSFGGFKGKNGYTDVEYYFDNTNWPRLLYWTNEYISFIKSKVKPEIDVIHVGNPIFFSDHPFTFPQIPSMSVSVFDVSPLDSYRSAILFPDPQYRTFENGKKFLTDIYEVFGKSGFTIVWKRKRSFHSVHNTDYIQFCDEFEKLPNVIIIHPEVSAFHVIEHCSYTISMPFTSTAFVARSFHKPSVFYDASCELYTDDRGRQNIPLISGVKALETWKNQLIN